MENTGVKILKITEGSYDFRFCSQPYEYPLHRIPKNSGLGFDIKCAGLDCVLCDVNKSREIFPCFPKFMGVIRMNKSKEFKILDFGMGLYSPLRQIIKDPHWGNPQHYSLRVVRKDPLPGRSNIVITPQAYHANVIKPPFDLCLRMKELCAPNTNQQIMDFLSENSEEIGVVP